MKEVLESELQVQKQKTILVKMFSEMRADYENLVEKQLKKLHGIGR